MKVLLVGEGKHDVGKAGADTAAPAAQRTIGGVIGTLVRKQYPAIAADSTALLWREIPRFGRGFPGQATGYAGKVAAAIVLAQRKLGADGVICVLDRDGEDQRETELRHGRHTGLALVGADYPVACGLAVESIEAWTLGAKSALVAELGGDAQKFAADYPRGVAVECLSEKSRDESRRPKALLQKLAARVHRNDCTELREEVAARTDFAELTIHCPSGFAPFAAELHAAFGSKPNQAA